MVLDLTPKKALIFRITHKNNIPWILDNGLRCANSPAQDPNFVQIGHQGLISRRGERQVPVPPHGTLSDYVPFYFTPRTPMMGSIVKGQNVPQVDRGNIVILVSSLHRLAEQEIPFVFTDRHAYLAEAEFYSDTTNVGSLDWENWRNSDFARNSENPEKFSRYQAETLVHGLVPIHALLGLACYDDDSKVHLSELIGARNLGLPIKVKKEFYV